jgi:hypothetical protein
VEGVAGGQFILSGAALKKGVWIAAQKIYD